MIKAGLDSDNLITETTANVDPSWNSFQRGDKGCRTWKQTLKICLCVSFGYLDSVISVSKSHFSLSVIYTWPSVLYQNSSGTVHEQKCRTWLSKMDWHALATMVDLDSQSGTDTSWRPVTIDNVGLGFLLHSVKPEFFFQDIENYLLAPSEFSPLTSAATCSTTCNCFSTFLSRTLFDSGVECRWPCHHYLMLKT